MGSCQCLLRFCCECFIFAEDQDSNYNPEEAEKNIGCSEMLRTEVKDCRPHVNQNTGKTTKLVSQSTFKDLVGITYTNGSLYVADSQTVFGPFVSGVAEATKDRPGVIWKITLP